jgi:hypothetical protein
MNPGTAHREVDNRTTDMDYIPGSQIDSSALPPH